MFLLTFAIGSVSIVSLLVSLILALIFLLVLLSKLGIL